jgi:hypothetical protein
MPPKTQREREAEQRQVKLERIQEQVEEGSLVIRQMTEDERATFEQKQRERPQPAGGAAKRRSRSTRKSRPLPPVSKG